MAKRFERIIDKLPYSADDIIGQAISYFLKEQDPDRVRWEVILDGEDVVGWSVKIKTDKENVEEAKDFWKDNVDPMLGGNQ